MSDYKLQTRVDFPGYSTHPVYTQKSRRGPEPGFYIPNSKKDSLLYEKMKGEMRGLNALDLAGVKNYELILTHTFRDLVHLNAEQANLFFFGNDGEKVADNYITSHLYTREDLETDAKVVSQSKTTVGVTLLDSDKHPINKVDRKKYAESVVSLLAGDYHAKVVDLDFEWHCSDYAEALLDILTYIREKDPSIQFTATCYKGSEDVEALKLLKKAFPELTLNTMAYFESVKQQEELIELYEEVFKPEEIFLGVSVKTTPLETGLALVKLAKKMMLGGIFFWNGAQDVMRPQPHEAPDSGKFPYIQRLQAEMEGIFNPVGKGRLAALCEKISCLFRNFWG